MKIENILCNLLFLILINFSKTAVDNKRIENHLNKSYIIIKREADQLSSQKITQEPTMRTALINISSNMSSEATSTETIITSKVLVNVNGTGEQKKFTKPDIRIDSKVLSDAKKNGNPVKKYSTPSTIVMESADLDVLKNVDVPDNETINIIKKHNYTVDLTEEHHSYYNSTLFLNPELIHQYWTSFKDFVPNSILSASHRRAMTVKLSFDFPFYGSLIRNITVATGGFIYTGEQVHAWLAATQYIAPLMANFDTRITNKSFVRYDDNGTAFTAVWDNVYLQDKQEVDPFTFSATLHNTGDIVFAYFNIPVEITTILDDKHPVKVGLSDAYITDESEVKLTRKKTIYEYHRVNFNGKTIQSNTVIYLKALPTCLSQLDCESCTNNDIKFNCFWCPALKICSTGTDRKMQDWSQNCVSGKIKEHLYCPAEISRPSNNFSAVVYNDYNNKDNSTEQPIIEHSNNFDIGVEKFSTKINNDSAHRTNFGLTLGLFIPVCLILTLLLWVLYAYRNPHSKSGQLLIQYRPSQWSWRRGEARYTAATIHM